MKNLSQILFAIIVINASYLNAQELREDTLALKRIDKIIIDETLRIIRIDTFVNSSNLIRISGFDANNRIVKIESRNSLPNDLKIAINQVQFYDSFGNLILDLQYWDGIAMTRHLFVYNEKNNLTMEKLLFGGIEEKRIEYQYDKKGKLTEKVEYLNGVILTRKNHK